MNVKTLVVRCFDPALLFSIELDQYFYYILRNAHDACIQFENNLVQDFTVKISFRNYLKVYAVEPNFLKQFENDDRYISFHGLESMLLNDDDIYIENINNWKVIEYPYKNYQDPDFDKYYQFLSEENFDCPNQKILFENGVFNLQIYDNIQNDVLTSVSISFKDFINEIKDDIDSDYKPVIINRERITLY